MKFNAFLYKLFPCMKNYEQPQSPQSCLQLYKQRQKLLEERVEAERVEAERVEAERVEAERVEAERVETERVEAERVEAERVEAERVETERVETERVEAERVETERVEAERIIKIVDNIFRQYMDKFHEFFSSRSQPIHSNFNEKMFKDLCDTFTFNTEGELLECLDRYNLMQKQNKKAYNQLSRKRKLKCDVFKFYLFI